MGNPFFLLHALLLESMNSLRHLLRELQVERECGGRRSSSGPTDHIAAACTPRLPGRVLPPKAASPVILQLTPLKNETALKSPLLSH